MERKLTAAKNISFGINKMENIQKMNNQEQNQSIHMETLLQASLKNEIQKIEMFKEATRQTQLLTEAIKTCETTILRKTHEMSTLPGSVADNISVKVQNCIIQFENAARKREKHTEEVVSLQHRVDSKLNWASFIIAIISSLTVCMVFTTIVF